MSSEIVIKIFVFSIFGGIVHLFLAALKSANKDWSLVRSYFFFKKSLFHILRINSEVIQGDFIFPILVVFKRPFLSIQASN